MSWAAGRESTRQPRRRISSRGRKVAGVTTGTVRRGIPAGRAMPARSRRKIRATPGPVRVPHGITATSRRPRNVGRVPLGRQLAAWFGSGRYEIGSSTAPSTSDYGSEGSGRGRRCFDLEEAAVLGGTRIASISL